MLGTSLGRQRAPDTLDRRFAGFDQQLSVGIVTDVEPEEVRDSRQFDDLRLLVVEAEPAGLESLRQSVLDVLGLLTGVTHDQEVVGITHQDRASDIGFELIEAAFAPVSDACGLFHSVKSDVQKQGADDSALRGSFLGRGEAPPVFDHACLQPAPDRVLGGEVSEHGQKVVVVDSVERRGQIRVE
jgi:hypothetical protein